MSDKDLVKKLQGLKDIKPNQAWVSSVKTQIIGVQSSPSIFEVFSGVFSQRKLAYASLSLVVFLVGLFLVSFVTFTPSKETAEKLSPALLAAISQSKYDLGVANEKLESLTEATKAKKVEDIIVAIKEANDSILSASKTITKEIVSNPNALKEIADGVKKIDENKKTLATLGVLVDSDFQLNNVLQPLVLNEIEGLEKATLSDDQLITLKEIKGLYKQGQYVETLEKILLMGGEK